MKRKLSHFATLFLILLLITGCQTEEDFYSINDFETLEKIDTHVHLNTVSSIMIEEGEKVNMRVITINTDAWGGQAIEEQRAVASEIKNRYPERFEFATTFSMNGWDDTETWQQKTIDYLRESFEMGATGVKVWKNIGMTFKDKNGEFVMIDNPQFDPVIDFIREQGKPLLGHLGEPKNCWLPLDEMTTHNDRQYFENNPQYHMHLHPENPSYEEIIQATNNMLGKHPGLDYIGIHLGSMEWSVEMMAEHLDRFPQMTLDMAHRIPHLQYLAKQDREKLRNFFINYQDQLIYSTDLQQYDHSDPDEVRELIRSTWREDWEFFVTDHTMTVWQVDGEFQGLKLPRQVIDNLYRENAKKWWFKESNTISLK